MSLYDSLQEKLENVHIYSGYFSSNCIFHDDTNPSMFVYEESDNRNYEFRCASCGKHGSLSYLDKYFGSHIRTQLTQSQLKPQVLPRWRRWEQEYGDLEGIARHAHENLKRYPQFQSYFKRRKIHEYIEEGFMGYLDGWATFPVFSARHTIVDIVVRTTNGKVNTRYVVHPDSSTNLRPLYSPCWQKVNDAQTIFVVYGLIDSWSLHAVGLPVVTGLSGKSLSAEQLKPLGKRYIIVPDLGEEREAYLLSNKLGWKSKVQLLKYENGCKDPDDLRRTFGNDYLLEALGLQSKDEENRINPRSICVS